MFFEFVVHFLTHWTTWLLIIIATVIYFYLNVRKKHSYWKKKGIPYIEPKFFVGNMSLIRTKSFAEKLLELYNAYPEERYHGMYQFTSPVLIAKDPDLIKQITVKEFDHFVNHRPIASVDSDPFWSKNLVASRDQRWRDLRSTLSPSFTGSKMRTMFSLMDKCAQEFIKHFSKENGDFIEVEMKDALSRYTNDVIASAAFGLECNSLEDKKNDFYTMGKEASNFGDWRILKFFLYEISPFLFKLLQIKIIPAKITDYFSKIIEDTVKTRKEKNIVRPDMIHLLMEAQKERQPDEKNQNKKFGITLDDINSQAFVFFLAGFETVSTFLTFALYELALHPEIQDRLRREIRSISGNITYESLLSLKYLDMVVNETLRKWPSALITDRQVTKDFIIDPVKPGERPFLLEKGINCWLPIFAIHNDGRFYPNPEKFDPERFSDENKHKIDPSVYIPFGAGPRNCIGSRFALLEGKLLISYILKNFEVVTCRKTQNPIVLDKKQLNLTVQGGMWLGLKKHRSV